MEDIKVIGPNRKGYSLDIENVEKDLENQGYLVVTGFLCNQADPLCKVKFSVPGELLLSQLEIVETPTGWGLANTINEANKINVWPGQVLQSCRGVSLCRAS